MHRTRRTSVSAESIDPSKDQYTRIVVPKTQEQQRRIQESIKSNFLFRHLEEEQHRDVVDAMSEKHVAEGETVIKQGAIGDYFYVVESGRLAVWKSIGGKEPIIVANIGSGGSFGELALMYNAPRAATVVATEPCTLWALDRVTFRRILLDSCSRKRRMYEDFLEEVELLKGLDEYERHKIADALESVAFEDGSLVITQGETGDAFYLIESGEARVIKVCNPAYKSLAMVTIVAWAASPSNAPIPLNASLNAFWNAFRDTGWLTSHRRMMKERNRKCLVLKRVTTLENWRCSRTNRGRLVSLLKVSSRLPR